MVDLDCRKDSKELGRRFDSITVTYASSAFAGRQIESTTGKVLGGLRNALINGKTASRSNREIE